MDAEWLSLVHGHGRTVGTLWALEQSAGAHNDAIAMGDEDGGR